MQATLALMRDHDSSSDEEPDFNAPCTTDDEAKSGEFIRLVLPE